MKNLQLKPTKKSGPMKNKNKNIHVGLVGGVAGIVLGLMILAVPSFADDAKPSDQAKANDEAKPVMVAKATYVGTETCATCHEKEYKEFKRSSHSRITVSETEGVNGCEMCHGPGSIHADNGGGKGTMINPNKNPETCFTCHSDKRFQFKLPFHHPVLEGKMSCSDCHSAHGEDVRPWSATTFEGVNETCFKCHKDQQGPFVWGHEAIQEGCTTCHQVHGSLHEKMLTQRDNNLCLKCHTQVNFPTIGKSGHGTRLPQGSCFSGGCHTAVHGSNFDDHLRY